MKQMIETIIKTIATKPEAVTINEIKGDESSIFEVTVDKQDLGKMIGKGGKNAQAIRTLVFAASYKFGNRRYQIEVKSLHDE